MKHAMCRNRKIRLHIANYCWESHNSIPLLFINIITLFKKHNLNKTCVVLKYLKRKTEEKRLFLFGIKIGTRGSILHLAWILSYEKLRNRYQKVTKTKQRGEGCMVNRYT